MIYRMIVLGCKPIDYDHEADAMRAAWIKARNGAEVTVQKLEQVVSYTLISITTVRTTMETPNE